MEILIEIVKWYMIGCIISYLLINTKIGENTIDYLEQQSSEDIRKEGRKWMKKCCVQCSWIMVVLIVMIGAWYSDKEQR